MGLGNSVKTYAVGDVAESAIWNADVRDNIEALRQPPMVRAYRSSGGNPNPGSGSFVALSLNNERFDTDSMWGSSEPTRVTINTAGKYFMSAHIQWAGDATGYRQTSLRINGSTGVIVATQRNNNLGASDKVIQSVATVYAMSTGEYVEQVVFQNSGGALNVEIAGNYSPELSVTWVGN